jgi:hypothetical protein
MPFNPEQGEFKKESNVKRFILALSFLGLFYLAFIAMTPTAVMPHVERMMAEGAVTWQNGSAPIRFNFYRIKFVDSE